MGQNSSHCWKIHITKREIETTEQVTLIIIQIFITLTFAFRYCDIDTQGNKALVMKQYLEDEKVEEIGEIIEMKITHRKNLERRKAKFGYNHVSMIFVLFYVSYILGWNQFLIWEWI